jgi:hypothetical protein
MNTNDINNTWFAVPHVGIDPVTKGQFIIQSGYMIWDGDEENMTSRALCNVFIRGQDNPLFQLGVKSPLRLQGLVASVMFSIEKRFVRFFCIKDFDITNDGLVHEIEMSVVFDILEGNLEYLESIIEYKDENLL